MTPSGDIAPLTTLFGILVMLAGALVVTGAALLEHYTGRSNFIMRWLWRQ